MSPQILGYAVIFILLLVLFFVFSLKSKADPAWKAEVIVKINEISKLSSSREPLILSTLVIEADKLLGHVMKMRNVKGETVGERLKNAKSFFDQNLYNRIWEAHKIRNQIAHEQNFKLGPSDLKSAVGILLKASRNLSHN
jgi:hypothetical protein